MKSMDASDFDTQVQQLETLIDELLKEKPQEVRVKTAMRAMGLKYCLDPVERMNQALAVLDGFRKNGESRVGSGEISLGSLRTPRERARGGGKSAKKVSHPDAKDKDL